MIDIQEPQTAPPKKRKGWAIAAALVLFMGGGALGWSLAADQPAPTSVTASPVTVGEAPPGQSPVPLSGDEPVAAVAELLLPSVIQIETGGGVGSGVIYDKAGLALTAAHVVQGSDQVEVRLADGRRVEGTVVGGDTGADIAVVRIEAGDLVAAPLALGEELRVGQMAIALGSPWRLSSTVTAGIVSAVDRSISSEDGAHTVIQTDAPINPGNSGGPLADRAGRVIGINVSIFSFSGGNDGVGFAVPIDAAYDLAKKLVAGEPIETAFLGVSGDEPVTGRLGASLQEIVPGGPAEAAGLEVGDLIVSIDGEPVQSMVDLAANIRERQPGDTVRLTVVRNGAEEVVTVTLTERPN